MTPTQLHIMQHTLGLDAYGQGTFYRNRFVTGPDCDNYTDCRALVDAGFMVEHPPRALFGGHSCFTVTDAGLVAVAEQSPKPPKRTRSQLRYDKWLRIDGVESFGEWLRRGGAL